jgi:hypothetical protein
MTWVTKHCRKRYTEEEMLAIQTRLGQVSPNDKRKREVSPNDKRKREVSPNDKASLVLTTRLDELSPSDKSTRC